MTRTIKAIYFSPTKTTENIIKKIATSIPDSTTELINLTTLESRNDVKKLVTVIW